MSEPTFNLSNPDIVRDIFASVAALMPLIQEFVEEQITGNSWSDVKIDEYGTICYEKNDSCACHPNYIWEPVSNEAFIDWLMEKKKLEIPRSVPPVTEEDITIVRGYSQK